MLVGCLDLQTLQDQAERIGLVQCGEMIFEPEVDILYAHRYII